MIPVLAGLDKVHGIPVALRRCVSIMKMGCSPGQCESDFALAYLRQSVVPAYQNRLPITSLVGRAGSNAIKTPGPTPDVIGRIRVIYPTELCLTNLIEFLRKKLSIALVCLRIGRRLQARHRLLDRHDVQRSHKPPRWRTGPRNQISCNTIGRTEKL